MPPSEPATQKSPYAQRAVAIRKTALAMLQRSMRTTM
jgi:hypothetical protein